MTDSTLLITLSRLLVPGTPDPLVFSADLDGTLLGIVGYQAPARQGEVTYTTDSPRVTGSVAIASKWQQTVLGWDWVSDQAASESDVQAAFEEVAEALGQFTYTVTTQVAGAPAQAWKAYMGALVPSPRSYEDLANSNPVFAVTVPIYPIPGV